MIYAVGDVHGQAERLITLVSRLPLTAMDHLIFLGDYIDRGPDSKGVLDFLVELKSTRPRTTFLRGNHEQMLLDALDAYEFGGNFGEAYALWSGNGGSETMDSYPARRPWSARIPDTHWEFLEQTILEYELDEYIFVHAGVLPDGVPWPYEEDPRLWIREPFITSRQDFGGVVIYGHTPQRNGKPLILPNKICIDTAAGFGGPLTAIQIDPDQPHEYQFIQA